MEQAGKSGEEGGMLGGWLHRQEGRGMQWGDLGHGNISKRGSIDALKSFSMKNANPGCLEHAQSSQRMYEGSAHLAGP